MKSAAPKPPYLYELVTGRSAEAYGHWFSHERKLTSEQMRELVVQELQKLAPEHDAQIDAREAFIREHFGCEPHEVWGKGPTVEQRRSLDDMLPPPLLYAAMSAAGFVKLKAEAHCHSWNTDRESAWTKSVELIEDITSADWRSTK